MELFIPACGDRLTLTKDWTFPLWLERRNIKFARSRELLGEDEGGSRWTSTVWDGAPYRSQIKRVDVTLPAGTIIECDRIYIRQYNKSRLEEGNDYDSVTWKVIDPKKGKTVRHGRFWSKLQDCNGLSFELAFDGRYQDRVKAVKAVMET